MRHISECVGEVLAELIDQEAAMAAARAALVKQAPTTEETP